MLEDGRAETRDLVPRHRLPEGFVCTDMVLPMLTLCFICTDMVVPMLTLCIDEPLLSVEARYVALKIPACGSLEANVV